MMILGFYTLAHCTANALEWRFIFLFVICDIETFTEGKELSTSSTTDASTEQSLFVTMRRSHSTDKLLLCLGPQWELLLLIQHQNMF